MSSACLVKRVLNWHALGELLDRSLDRITFLRPSFGAPDNVPCFWPSAKISAPRVFFAVSLSFQPFRPVTYNPSQRDILPLSEVRKLRNSKASFLCFEPSVTASA